MNHGLVIDEMVENILGVYLSATPEEHAIGEEWYPVAHALCEGWSALYEVTVEQACGVLAAISPRLNWDLNVSYAERIMREGYAPIIGSFLAKALAILASDTVTLDSVGKVSSHKIRSFYQNILKPEQTYAVTIDRHALDVALGFIGTDKSRKVLDRVGAYEAVAEAYRIVASKVGLSPDTVQAITWVTHRNQKGEK